jgi:hypothetical protein
VPAAQTGQVDFSSSEYARELSFNRAGGKQYRDKLTIRFSVHNGTDTSSLRVYHPLRCSRATATPEKSGPSI